MQRGSGRHYGRREGTSPKHQGRSLRRRVGGRHRAARGHRARHHCLCGPWPGLYRPGGHGRGLLRGGYRVLRPSPGRDLDPGYRDQDLAYAGPGFRGSLAGPAPLPFRPRSFVPRDRLPGLSVRVHGGALSGAVRIAPPGGHREIHPLPGHRRFHERRGRFDRVQPAESPAGAGCAIPALARPCVAASGQAPQPAGRIRHPGLGVCGRALPEEGARVPCGADRGHGRALSVLVRQRSFLAGAGHRSPYGHGSRLRHAARIGGGNLRGRSLLSSPAAFSGADPGGARLRRVPAERGCGRQRHIPEPRQQQSRSGAGRGKHDCRSLRRHSWCGHGSQHDGELPGGGEERPFPEWRPVS